MKLRRPREPQRRHDAPGQSEQIVLRKPRRCRSLAKGQQDRFALEREHHDRQRDQKPGPQSRLRCPPHPLRVARAERLGHQRRHRRHQAHAEGEADEIDRPGQRCCGDRIAAEAADEAEIGGHHRDLRQLRQRHRRGEPDSLPEFVCKKINGCRRLRRRIHPRR
jgi:hypothetical protein